MRSATASALDELDEFEWFTKVGVRDVDFAIVLRSWKEAVAHGASPEWENLRIDAANMLTVRLLKKSKTRFAEWNEVVDALKPVVEPFVRRKIAKVVRENHLPKTFEDSVQWDILHVCLETEFSDVVPLSFYAGNAYWYMNGHFPCGWQGPFPDGKPVIY